MTKTVFKYIIPVREGEKTHQLPLLAKFLHVGRDPVQPKEEMLYVPNVALWFEVDTEADTEERHFAIFGTGEKLTLRGDPKYLGSVSFDVFRLPLIWHVYEIHKNDLKKIEDRDCDSCGYALLPDDHPPCVDCRKEQGGRAFWVPQIEEPSWVINALRRYGSQHGALCGEIDKLRKSLQSAKDRNKDCMDANVSLRKENVELRRSRDMWQNEARRWQNETRRERASADDLQGSIDKLRKDKRLIQNILDTVVRDLENTLKLSDWGHDYIDDFLPAAKNVVETLRANQAPLKTRTPHK